MAHHGPDSSDYIDDMGARNDIQETLIENIRGLLRSRKMNLTDLAARSGLSLRMIRFILDRERIPTIESIEKVATAFHVSPWQLLTPGFHKTSENAGAIRRLLIHYVDSDEKGRSHIGLVAEREAEYNRNKT